MEIQHWCLVVRPKIELKLSLHLKASVHYIKHQGGYITKILTLVLRYHILFYSCRNAYLGNYFFIWGRKVVHEKKKYNFEGKTGVSVWSWCDIIRVAKHEVEGTPKFISQLLALANYSCWGETNKHSIKV